MGEAAKKWMTAVEYPSNLVAENKKLRDAIHRAGFQVLQTSGDWSIHDVSELAKSDEARTNQVIAENIDLRIEIKSLKKQLAAAPYVIKHGDGPGQCRELVLRDMPAFVTIAHTRRSRTYTTHQDDDTKIELILSSSQSVAGSEDPRGDGDLLPESERLDRLTRECMRDEFDKMIEVTRKMDEPPVCKHEKTRTVLGTPYDSHSIECVDCGCDVTHSEPVKSRKFGNCGRKNCRGVSHQVNHGYCRECQSAIDEMTDSLTVLSAKPKRDLIVAESPNGLWHVWEQKTHGDYAMVAGPFHDSELANAAVDAIRAEEDVSSDAEDASDIERAIRERLMQPFLGSEAETIGAKEYQLRGGELWYFKFGETWEPAIQTPSWFDDTDYRLATGEQHGATY